MQVRIDRRFASAATLLALSSVAAPGAYAQRTQVDALQEVIVTAQRREEKLLDVPMSITAVTGEALTRQGATSLLDLSSIVPGLSTVEFTPGQNRVQLRGISSLQGNPTVGTYLDEMPLNVEGGFPNYGADVRFIDLERVEVLRGPQGTLYGEGSMGGTIRYITRNPDLTDASFGFDTAIGTVKDGSELYRANVVVNVPVVQDVFGLRLAGGYERNPGWIDYPAFNEKDVNEGTSKTARLKSLWKVTDAFSASLLLLYQDTELDANNLGTIATRTSSAVLKSPYLDENKMGSLTLNYDAGSFSVLNATSYGERTSDQTLDFTTLLRGAYIFLGPIFGFDGTTIRTIAANQFFEFKALTEELRLASKGDGALSWTGGVYYRKYEQAGAAVTQATPSVGFEILPRGALGRSESSAQAVFGEVTYSFTPKFDTSVGLRYERGDTATLGPTGQDTDFSTVNPRVVFSFRPVEDTLIFVGAANGYRAGGFNGATSIPAGCDIPLNYDPEDLRTYEIGSNVSTSGGRVVVQGAVFYNDWKDIQIRQFCSNIGSLGGGTGNGGKATGKGFDLQVTLNPVSTLTVALAASYNDSKYEESSAAHQAGDRVDFVPEFTGSVSGDYSFNWTGSLPGRFHLDYQYTDEFSIALRNLLGNPEPVRFSDANGRLNARLSALRDAWEFLLFGQNLTDTNKQAIPVYGGYGSPTSYQPRTIGVGIRYNY